MTQGYPAKPTCLSIVGGISLAGLILAAFVLLPNIVKWMGATFTFLPGQLGLIRVVAPDEVLPVDVSFSPTEIVFRQPGRYALFTSNYDLLLINDSVITAKAKPWFKLKGDDGDEVAITLVERGLAFYDTPIANGRPVALFTLSRPGSYTMIHPIRPDFVYIVPDYTFGHEGAITFYMLLQAVALGAGVWYLRRRLRRPRAIVVAPPSTRRNRERYLADQVEAEQASLMSPQQHVSGELQQSEAAVDTLSVPAGRDVLEMVRGNDLTAQQAEAEIEALLLSQPAGTQTLIWGAKLSLSPSETAAYAQGAGVHDLLALRFEGWPSACAHCGGSIDHRRPPWWFVRDSQGKPGLRHIQCPLKTA